MRLGAEAPELKTVMPNSWQRVTKLSAREENDFLVSNMDLIEKQKNEIKNYRIGSDSGLNSKMRRLDAIQIYKQTVGDDIFYRVLFVAEEQPKYVSKDCQFVQMLVYNNMRLAVGVYNRRQVVDIDNKQRKDSSVLCTQFDSIDIVETFGKARGILLTKLLTKIDDDWNLTGIRKGRLYGSTEAVYYWLRYTPEDGFIKCGFLGVFGDEERFPYDEAIQIHASNCLVDKAVPLKYSLQNAFDHNPATSYVENTDDDLAAIYVIKTLSNNLFTSTAFSMINGYAQNSTLYYNNNRIKAIAYSTKFGYSWANIEYQRYKYGYESYYDKDFISVSYPESMAPVTHAIKSGEPVVIEDSAPMSALVLLVSEVYAGNKYNDTCIAEINIKTEDGWIFGAQDD
jgi:hypothetical protein